MDLLFLFLGVPLLVPGAAGAAVLHAHLKSNKKSIAEMWDNVRNKRANQQASQMQALVQQKASEGAFHTWIPYLEGKATFDPSTADYDDVRDFLDWAKDEQDEEFEDYVHGPAEKVYRDMNYFEALQKLVTAEQLVRGTEVNPRFMEHIRQSVQRVTKVSNLLRSMEQYSPDFGSSDTDEGLDQYLNRLRRISKGEAVNVRAKWDNAKKVAHEAQAQNAAWVPKEETGEVSWSSLMQGKVV